MNGRRHGLDGGDVETVRIGMLGGFRVAVGDRILPENAWRLKKAAALMKLLALAPNHHLHREQVMELLWPTSDTKTASNRLRKALHAARRALDTVEGPRYLASENDSLVLCPGCSLWVDVEAFEQAVSTARRERAPAAYRAAMELYAGDLLPEDRYEEWAEERRHALRQIFLSLLIELSHVYQRREEHGQAVEVLRRAVAEESTFEEAHAGLMRLYALLGREREALAQHERLREILSRQLGTEPSSVIKRLRDEITSGEFASAFSSLTESPREEDPLESPRHDLPAPRTSFIGRERELLEVKRELAMTRLLTLTGTGGSGKTRLALEVARSLAGAYPDGVGLVELASLSEGALVPQAVAQALGVKERPDQSLTETLAEVLSTRQTLLVLDNCEHMVEAVARLVDVLLDACPGVRVLATSRERLDIAGEMNWLVPPLSVPDPRQQPTAEELERYESVRLFVERARYHSPTFVLSTHEMQDVAQICRRLDGLPLAIELAAARVGLSAEQIAARLDDSLRLLTTGSRTATARQRTLRGALDWSYDLLGEAERVLFGRLSVFAGGFSLEAAEAVASGEGVMESEVLDLLSSLVDKSLVVAEAIGEGGARYRLLEPVRQYALEKSEKSGEAQTIEWRHATFFLAMAEEVERRQWGPDEATGMDRLETEHDNLRAALSWALQREEGELGLRLAGALGQFWRARGHDSEGRKWIEEALEKGSRSSAMVRTKAVQLACWLASSQGDLERAQAAAEEGLQLCEEAGIGGVVAANFTHTLGEVAGSRGDYELAMALHEEGLRLCREAEDVRQIAFSLLLLGHASVGRGDIDRAKQVYKEGLALSQTLGGSRPLVSFLVSLGYEFLLEGKYEEATILNEEAVEVFRQHRHRGGLQFALDNLGWAALLRGDPERAKALHEESLRLCRDLNDQFVAVESIEGLACSAEAEGDAERAARLFASAKAWRETAGFHPTSRENALRQPYWTGARSRLDEPRWETTFAEGKAMTLDQAVEYALSEHESSTFATRTTVQTSSDTARSPVLTRRETEVAMLVAQGLTNRQIAQELFVSKRTVDHHVSNVLKKLTITSREQVGYRLTDHQPHLR